MILKEKLTKDIKRSLDRNIVLSTYLSNNICVTDIFKVCFKTLQMQSFSSYNTEFLKLTIILKTINPVASDEWTTVVAQWVRSLAPQAESWVFESQI